MAVGPKQCAAVSTHRGAMIEPAEIGYAIDLDTEGDLPEVGLDVRFLAMNNTPV